MMYRQPLIRSAWRRVLRWRFRLFQRHRHDGLLLETILDTPILVLPKVFNPKLFRTGEALARWVDATVRPGESVLDLGTGSGVGSVFAARRASRVVAVDLNPMAVRCAQINALIHGLEQRIEVRQGDLFAPVASERFSLVLFNPPYYRGTPRDALEMAFRSDGVLERFASGLGDVLSPTGRALLVLSSDAGLPGIHALLEGHGFQIEVLEERDLVNEIICVWSLTLPCKGAQPQ